MTTPGKPLTRQRSEWQHADDDRLTQHLADMGAADVRVWWRNVRDGQLRAIVAREPDHPGADGPLLWHLSISHAKRGTGKRYPSWDEISHARYELLPDDVTMVMVLPPPDQFVAVHDTTFHLHELQEPTDA